MVFLDFLNALSSFGWVKKIATQVNQTKWVKDMIAPYIICMAIGVSGLTTWVNMLRKKTVALGFNALVINPVLNAENELIKPVVPHISISLLDLNVCQPTKIRYAAPKYFIMEKSKIDFEIITASPAIE